MAIPRNPLATALRGLDRQQAGQYVPDGAPFGGITGIALTASRTYVVRFIAERSMTITKVVFVLTVAASANDNCDVGIFDSTLATKLGSSGSTAGKLNGSLGAVTVNLAAGVQIRQGKVYYAAFGSGPQGGTAASVVMTNLPTNAVQMFGSTAGLTELTFQAAFPLAAPITPGGAIGSCPVLALLQ